MARRKSLHKSYGPDACRVLSGMLLDTAEAVPLSDRFRVLAGDQPNGVVVVDTSTGRRVGVPLHAYRTVREVLATLFPS